MKYFIILFFSLIVLLFLDSCSDSFGVESNVIVRSADDSVITIQLDTIRVVRDIYLPQLDSTISDTLYIIITDSLLTIDGVIEYQRRSILDSLYSSKQLKNRELGPMVEVMPKSIISTERYIKYKAYVDAETGKRIELPYDYINPIISEMSFNDNFIIIDTNYRFPAFYINTLGLEYSVDDILNSGRTMSIRKLSFRSNEPKMISILDELRNENFGYELIVVDKNSKSIPNRDFKEAIKISTRNWKFRNQYELSGFDIQIEAKIFSLKGNDTINLHQINSYLTIEW